jgi:hypothetical protein
MAGFLFVFVVHRAGVRRATYLCPLPKLYKENNWNINVSFIIHVKFDHA